MAKLKMSQQERQWEIEDAMRTLQRAEQIRQNSKLMGEVKKSMDNLSKMITGDIGKKPSPRPIVKKPTMRKK
jgi:hypothetical protein